MEQQIAEMEATQGLCAKKQITEIDWSSKSNASKFYFEENAEDELTNAEYDSLFGNILINQI